MRGVSDCCHYDDGYEDGFDDGRAEAKGLGGDMTLADLVHEWARTQTDPARGDAGMYVADAMVAVDVERLEAAIAKRRERLLFEYASSRGAEPAQQASTALEGGEG